jgi:hypothetical protein
VKIDKVGYCIKVSEVLRKTIGKEIFGGGESMSEQDKRIGKIFICLVNGCNDIFILKKVITESYGEKYFIDSNDIYHTPFACRPATLEELKEHIYNP